MMTARRLTDLGVHQFAEFLHAERTQPLRDAPFELLHDPQTAEPLDVVIDASFVPFRTRLELAGHLDQLLGHDHATLRHDAGFWSWLALCWFDELCPQRGGSLQPGDARRWVADVEDPRRSCRHILLGPYQIYRAHRDDPQRAMALLCGPPRSAGRLVRLFASRPSLVTCRAVVGVVTRLYYDRAKQRLRRGISGHGPGSPPRLADVLSQLDLTWDLHSMTTDQLLELLPAEFGLNPKQRHPRQRSLLELLPGE